MLQTKSASNVARDALLSPDKSSKGADTASLGSGVGPNKFDSMALPGNTLRPGSSTSRNSARAKSARSTTSNKSARNFLNPGKPSLNRVASARKLQMEKDAGKARKRRMRGGGTIRPHEVNMGLVSSGQKVRKLMAKMQLSSENLARITISFRKFDPDNTMLIDKGRLALVMEDLGRKPENQEELNNLFRQTDKDASGNINFDEFVSMMVTRVGFRATPGVMVSITSLEFTDDYRHRYESSSGRHKRKGSGSRKKAPTLEIKIGTFEPQIVKGTKERSKEFGMLYDQKAFLACPNPCRDAFSIQAIGDRRMFRNDGRLLKDVIGCCTFDIDALEETATTFALPLYVPMCTQVMARRESSIMTSQRRGSDLSLISDASDVEPNSTSLTVDRAREKSSLSARREKTALFVAREKSSISQRSIVRYEDPPPATAHSYCRRFLFCVGRGACVVFTLPASACTRALAQNMTRIPSCRPVNTKDQSWSPTVLLDRPFINKMVVKPFNSGFETCFALPQRLFCSC